MFDVIFLFGEKKKKKRKRKRKLLCCPQVKFLESWFGQKIIKKKKKKLKNTQKYKIWVLFQIFQKHTTLTSGAFLTVFFKIILGKRNFFLLLLLFLALYSNKIISHVQPVM